MDDGGEGQLAATMFLGIGRGDGALAVDLNDPGDARSWSTSRMRSSARSPR